MPNSERQERRHALHRLSRGTTLALSALEKVGLKAVGISGKDGSILQVDKKLAGGKDIEKADEAVASAENILKSMIGG